jgi:hypothetical protein
MASGFLFAINVGIKSAKITRFMFTGELGKRKKSRHRSQTSAAVQAKVGAGGIKRNITENWQGKRRSVNKNVLIHILHQRVLTRKIKFFSLRRQALFV